jgi:hypothetical protein
MGLAFLTVLPYLVVRSLEPRSSGGKGLLIAGMILIVVAGAALTLSGFKRASKILKDSGASVPEKRVATASMVMAVIALGILAMDVVTGIAGVVIWMVFRGANFRY